MASVPASPILLTLSAVLLLSISTVLAQTAPAPAPSGPLNLTAILSKDGQFTNFIRLLKESQADTQVQNQLNTTTEGFTIFAPTDNAFNNLKAGLLNDLNEQQKVQLVLYHIVPKFIAFSDFQFVSNPVRTQATGQDGHPFGLSVTAQNNQVNVSSGTVEVPVYNPIIQKKPLAIYQVDKVLVPAEFTEAKSPAAAPSPSTKKSSGSTETNSTASTADGPSGDDASGSSMMNMGLGLVVGLAMACMGALS